MFWILSLRLGQAWHPVKCVSPAWLHKTLRSKYLTIIGFRHLSFFPFSGQATVTRKTRQIEEEFDIPGFIIYVLQSADVLNDIYVIILKNKPCRGHSFTVPLSTRCISGYRGIEKRNYFWQMTIQILMIHPAKRQVSWKVVYNNDSYQSQD